MQKTKKKLLVWSSFLLLVLGAMTVSDFYYSGLSEKYPLLQETELLEGTVTGIIVHHKYTYIEIGSTTRRLIRPSFLKSKEPTYFHKNVSIGDRFHHGPNSNEVTLLKGSKQLSFIVSGYRNN